MCRAGGVRFGAQKEVAGEVGETAAERHARKGGRASSRIKFHGGTVGVGDGR